MTLAPGPARDPVVTVHATTIAIDGRAAVLRGPSGSGKSALALQLMAYGAELVADDRTVLSPQPNGAPLALAPPALDGKIEARGVGILNAASCATARVALVVDLGRVETERMPPARRTTLAGADLPLLYNAEMPHFAAAVLQYLKAGPALE